MKTLNTPENKAAFFAYYYGQLVMVSTTSVYAEPIDPSWAIRASTIEKWPIVNSYILLLKPLSQITEPDLLEWHHLFSQEIAYDYTMDFHGLLPSAKSLIEKEGESVFYRYRVTTDFLRSKGYLLPWRDLTVEEIFKRGWAKY